MLKHTKCSICLSSDVNLHARKDSSGGFYIHLTNDVTWFRDTILFTHRQNRATSLNLYYSIQAPVGNIKNVQFHAHLLEKENRLCETRGRIVLFINGPMRSFCLSS
jgi:hypothetical protein